MRGHIRNVHYSSSWIESFMLWSSLTLSSHDVPFINTFQRMNSLFTTIFEKKKGFDACYLPLLHQFTSVVVEKLMHWKKEDWKLHKIWWFPAIWCCPPTARSSSHIKIPLKVINNFINESFKGFSVLKPREFHLVALKVQKVVDERMQFYLEQLFLLFDEQIRDPKLKTEIEEHMGRRTR